MNRLMSTSVFVLLAFTFWKAFQPSAPGNLPRVAITQIIDHPALDQEREGILLALKEAGYVDGKNLKIDYQNAQGNITTAAQIAQKIVSSRPQVVVAISTPSAQSILSVTGNSKIPVVFTAVTDPVVAKLVNRLNEPNERVTGVSDYLPPKPQLDVVRKIVPHLKKLGIIYNPGETNSTTLVKELRDYAVTQDIEISTATASRTSEIAPAAESLVGKVDAIYVPNDNTAVAAIESVIQVGIRHRIPVLAGDEGSVRRGAIATAGYSRLKLGKLAGEMVVRILSGQTPRQIPIRHQHEIEMITNRDSATKMGVSLPKGESL